MLSLNVTHLKPNKASKAMQTQPTISVWKCEDDDGVMLFGVDQRRCPIVWEHEGVYERRLESENE
jgi:hypothetical protein